MASIFLYVVLLWLNAKAEFFQYCDSTPEERELILADVKASLSSVFKTGRRGFFGTNKGHFGGSNPTTNYGLVEFIEPRAPKGYENFLNSLNETHTWFGAGNLVNTSFFLGRQDALVWFGCTPPKVRYFHFRTFASVHTTDPVHFPDAGLGDTINNANINTTGGSDGSAPFNRTAVLISTADRETMEAIAKAFVYAGVGEGAINLDILPSRHWIRFLDDVNPYELKKLKLDPNYLPEDAWMAAKADALILLGRFTGFEDEDKSKDWLGSVSQSILFHRIKATNHIALSALPNYRSRKRGTGKSEIVLAESLESLRASLLRKMNTSGWLFLDSALFDKDIRDDFRCLLYDDYSVFYGGGRGFCDMQPVDVSFSKTPFSWSNKSSSSYFKFNDVPDPQHPKKSLTERVFVSIGVNHNTFKNVGFNSMMVSPLGNGFESPANSSYWYDDHMEGSAAVFGEGFDNLFALAVGRFDTCAALNNLFPGHYCDVKDESKMQAQTEIVAVERIYLEYETKTGPSIDELLQAEFFVFERPLND